MRKNILVLLILVLVLVFTLNSFTVSADSVNFSDVEGHWAEPAIKAMAEKGIVRGYPDGFFKPDGQITRAEILSLVMRLKKEKIVSGNGIKVLDVKPTDWFYSDLDDYLVKYNTRYNILNGNRFDPTVKATRGFMVGVLSAVIVDNMPLPGSGTTDFIDIDQVPEDLRSRLRKMRNYGFIAGYPDNTFRHGSNISRGEVARILDNIINPPTEDENISSNPENLQGIEKAKSLSIKSKTQILNMLQKEGFEPNQINVLPEENLSQLTGYAIQVRSQHRGYDVDVFFRGILYDNGLVENQMSIRYYKDLKQVWVYNDWWTSDEGLRSTIKEQSPQ